MAAKIVLIFGQTTTTSGMISIAAMHSALSAKLTASSSRPMDFNGSVLLVMERCSEDKIRRETLKLDTAKQSFVYGAKLSTYIMIRRD